MTTPTLRAYLACSLDGFIADARGGVDWLHASNDPALGFEAFDRSIDTVIVGRATFDQSLAWGVWTSNAHRTIILTRRPLPDPPPLVETFAGDARELVTRLARNGARQVWHMGGGAALAPCLEADLIDRYELFIIPILFGDGVPLFPRRASAAPRTFHRADVRHHARGTVELQYRRESAPAAE